jgi:hypothetical protein|tara:strand:- start:1221 stop:1544 length:324 start_codon:yes stop_codon:yes gene_type:complete
MSQIKITEKQLRNVVNEVIGFTTDYKQEAEDELKSFINVVSGPISNMSKSKALHGDDVIAQRIYQLTTPGGELHTLTQELIDLLESLPDKRTGSSRIGFRLPGEKKD